MVSELLSKNPIKGSLVEATEYRISYIELVMNFWREH